MPVADAIGDPDAAKSPNTKSQTGMMAVRLNIIDIVVILSKEAGPGPRLAAVTSRGDLDLDLLRLGFLTQRQPDCQHAGFVLGVDLAGIDRRR